MTLPATIRSMSPATIARVRALEEAARDYPQVPIATQHVLHAGLYARTIRIPAGVVLTSVLVKRPTLVVASGRARLLTEDGTHELDGYCVLPASAGRKSAWFALADTDITMLFATQATTVEEAEREFTDEAHLLCSRAGANEIVTTGE